MKKILIIIILFSVICVAGILFFEKIFNSTGSYDNKKDFTKNSISNIETQKTKEESLNLLNLSSSPYSSAIEGDIILGSKDAPITIIEYASLSCHHCAKFHNSNFDKINEDLIKTGKVRFIYRDFPLNAPALVAAISSACLYQQHKDTEQYYRYIKSLFASQDKWAFNSNYKEKLKQISALYGLNAKSFKKCSDGKIIENKILQGRIDGAKELKISATPTILVNGYVLKGAVDLKKIQEVINIISND